jgi:broad specificity phosphatase PhoE
MPSVFELVALIIISLQTVIPPSMGFVDDADVFAINGGGGVVVDDRTRTLAPFLVRLHLIRHGETHANVRGVVLGQGDSPLTEEGFAVARLAASSGAINGRGRLRYWRAYCSDLDRARTTARIVLGLDDDDDQHDDDDGDVVRLVADPRLREIAKGVREGYLKKFTVEEAMAMRRSEAAASSYGGRSDDIRAPAVDVDIPKLEGTDDAWRRAKEWIDSIVDDASDDYYSRIETRERDREDVGDSNDGDDDDGPKIYDVFALSHSALIRTMIHKMVDPQLPSDFARTREGSLDIPNLSRTIIDVRPYSDISHPSPGNNDASSSSTGWTPSLRRLADVSHLHGSEQKGPPYL